MPVQVATLDILTERAHFDPLVARAIGDAIAMENTLSREGLATKLDLMDLRSELKSDMNELRSTIRAEMADLKTEMTRWMFGGFVSIFVALTGMMYFMLQHVR
jgi:hypothetical protein